MITNLPLLFMMLIMGETMHVGGKGGIWELSVLSSQFCYETKTALKVKSIKNNMCGDPGEKWTINLENLSH